MMNAPVFIEISDFVIPKRISLFVFHDENGIVRPFISYFLNELKTVSNRIIVISNSKINADSRKQLETSGIEVLVRENNGFDFNAWQYAICDYAGFKTLADYDELILCNDQAYGPVYPLKECFKKMAGEKCDFWGMTCHPENKSLLLLTGDKEAFVRKHLQNWFMLIRKQVLVSDAFKSWWKNLETYDNYNKDAFFHENLFTEYLSNAGFTYQTLGEIDSGGLDPALYYADQLLSSGKIPFVHRKVFTSSREKIFPYSANLTASNVLAYIRGNTTYNPDLILDDLTSTQKVGILRGCLCLNYTLPSALLTARPENKTSGDKPSLAILHYAYYPDIADYYCRYIRNMPEDAHIYIISSREDTLAAYREKLQDIKNPLEFRIKPNRGRDVSGYLVAGADIFKRHDIVCCTHDKKSPQVHPLITRDFNENGLRCILESKEYVLNIIDLFQQNPRLGLIVPPAPAFGPFATIANENSSNNKLLAELCKDFGINIPLDQSQLAPFGSVFWVKRQAMETILSRNWEYTDFPDEPLPVDGTVSHAIERFYPIAAQNDGFLTSICMPDTYSSIYFNNIFYQYREILKGNARLFGTVNYTKLSEIYKKTQIRPNIKKQEEKEQKRNKNRNRKKNRIIIALAIIILIVFFIIFKLFF